MLARWICAGLTAVLLAALVIAFGSDGSSAAESKTAIFAGGCFWCVEAAFDEVPGVTETISGYAGGTAPNPTYGSHEGYKEAVKVTYDPAKVTYAKLLDHYWHNIDPFDADGQFCDKGSAYQSVVFVGDVLFRMCTPIGWEGTYERWTTALDRIAALNPSVVVPGHGPLCGIEGVREMKAYLEYVRGESQRCFNAGLSALDAAKRIELGPYAEWTEPERLIFNVERAYREFRGEPYDAPIDAAAMFRGMFEVRDVQRARRAR